MSHFIHNIDELQSLGFLIEKLSKPYLLIDLKGDIKYKNSFFEDQFEKLGPFQLVFNNVFEILNLCTVPDENFYVIKNSIEMKSNSVEYFFNFINFNFDLYISTESIPGNNNYRIVNLELINKESTKTKKKFNLLDEKTDAGRHYYDDLFAYLPVGIYRTKPDGTILFANPTFKSMFDIPSNLYRGNLGWLANELVYERDKFINDISQSGEVTNYRSKLTKSDGTIKYFTEYARAIYGSDNKIEFFEGIIFDNTEAIEKDKSLKESEEKYKLLFDRTEDAVLLLSRDRWIDCNLAALKLFKYKTSDDIIGKHPHEISPITQPNGKLSSQVSQEMIDVAFEKGYNHFEWVHKKSDGELFYTDVMLTAIPYKGQTLLHSVLRDITLRKKAEENLILSEEKFRLIFENSNDVIALISEEGEILEVSPAIKNMTGYDVDEVLGMDIWDFQYLLVNDLRQFDLNSKIQYKKHIQDRIAQYNINNYNTNQEVVIKTKYGETKYLSTHSFLVNTSSGLRYCTFSTDISRQKQIEIEINHAKELYKTLVNTSPTPFVVVDEKGIIKFISDNVMDLLDTFEIEQIVDKPALSFVAPNERKKAISAFNDINDNKPVKNLELRINHSKWGRFFVEINATKLRGFLDIPDGILISITDISSRKEVELTKERAIKALLSATEKRHEALQLLDNSARLASIGVITGGITHEITQPINAIRIGAEGIISWDKISGNVLPQVVIKMLDGIIFATTRVDEIIKHMRSYWLENDEDTSLSTVNLNKSVLQAANLAKLKVQSHEIHYKLSLSDEELFVKANNVQLELVINNLIVNAVNALDKSLKKDKMILISTYRENDDVCLEVMDNGIGLPTNNQHQLFDPFFSTRHNEGGTGLGLAIVKMFLDKFSARILTLNNEDGGATFKILFNSINKEE